MRTALIALSLLAAATHPALADGDDDAEDAAYASLPRRAIAVGLYGHSSRVDGRTERGIGPQLELSLGRGRWQYVAEGQIATSSRDDIDGNVMRAALGVRWLARQFAPTRHGGLELLLAADAGAQRLSYHGGARTVRPEVVAGVAIQGRIFEGPRVFVRFDLRAVFTPADDDRMHETGASTGFQTGLTCGF